MIILFEVNVCMSISKEINWHINVTCFRSGLVLLFQCNFPTVGFQALYMTVFHEKNKQGPDDYLP